MSSSKLLVTTALEETWSQSDTNFFIGDWCKIYDRFQSWENLKHEINSYHWDDINKLIKDINYLETLVNSIIIELSKTLNKLHKKDYSTLYWKILCGHWTSLFTQILYDRWEVVRTALDSNHFFKTKIISIENKEMVPQGIENFILMCHQDKWNHFIFSKILKSETYKKNIKIEEINSIKNDDFKKDPYYPFKINYKLFFILAKTFSPIIKLFRSRQKYFISETYLSKKKEILLNLSLGLVPINIIPRYYSKSKFEASVRNKISLNLTPKNDFEKLLYKLIIENLPLSFVEDFENLSNSLNKIGWPKKPKLIFTSHFINNKSIGSIYVAEKKENGAKLIHGQHGGGYGQNFYHWYETFEKSISDKYISWGWTDKADKKVLSFGILKPLEKYVKINRETSKKIMIVIRPKERYSATALDTRTRGPQLKRYHEDCIKIAKILDINGLKEKLLVRLHERKYGWSEEYLWKKNFPQILIDRGFDSIMKSISESKVVIYTYNATGYLELMASNFPVLIYWNNKENKLRNDAEKNFIKLKEAKIFHDSVESLTNHLLMIEKNIERWWKDAKTQNAVKDFCKVYANFIPNKRLRLKKIIRGEIKNEQ